MFFDDMDFIDILAKLAERSHLSVEEAKKAFETMIDGHVPSERMAAFLMALRVKGTTQEELLGAVTALRAQMCPFKVLPERAIDVCGTGGDRYGTLNVSTAVAFVLAGLRVPVIKHGNRAISSRSGAADVLSALGVPFILPSQDHEMLLQKHRAVFLAASHYYPAMPHIAAVRKILGLPTLFNIMGPLLNPACVKRQLIGVFSREWLETMVKVLHTLGSERVWAVCSLPFGETRGVDELTLSGSTSVVALEHGRYYHFTIEPNMAGFSFAPMEALQGGDPSYNAGMLEDLLRGAPGAYRDTVLLNAACALHIAGKTTILRHGMIDPMALQESVALAASSLESGAAFAVLQGLRSFSTMMET
ncbi:MAG: anthranilate phosphoribosyltransferase [Acetobacter sp.]|nr:anthranilate phosphoribosyltransferase [Acetobacter sp.]